MVMGMRHSCGTAHVSPLSPHPIFLVASFHRRGPVIPASHTRACCVVSCSDRVWAAAQEKEASPRIRALK